jgi:uncharacterized protein (TIGR00255 family)
MTGYGRAEQSVNDKNFLIEVRSLNSKQFDIRLTMPPLLKPYEFDIRNALSEGFIRGSIECNITLKQNGSVKSASINIDLIKAYYAPVAKLAKELNVGVNDILSSLLKLPDVVSSSDEVLSENEWNDFQQILNAVVIDLNLHRKEEGLVLENDLLQRIENIEKQIPAIAALESKRREKIKENLVKLLEEYVGKDSYDKNRLEQELVYYIEKIDISEEQIRLKNHCDYFRKTLEQTEVVKGKKLSFILQEIGREINTTGAKAYDSDIQKIVVLMKDEVEKAKEQVLNVL